MYHLKLSHQALTLMATLGLICLGCDDEPQRSGEAGAEPEAAGSTAGTAGAAGTAGVAGAAGAAGTAGTAGAAGTEGGSGLEGFSDDGAPSGERGRYQVGYRSFSFEYELPEALAQSLSQSLEREETSRELRLALWYPTEDTEGEVARYPFLASQRGALADASPAPLTGRAPLLLYSHGAKVWPELGVFLHEHFASHGWLVAAVEHDHDDLQSAVAPRPDSMYLLRPRDLSEALTQLIELKVSGEDPIAALLDERYVYAAGHSFGGYTTFAVAGARFDLAGLEAGCAERSETFCDELERLRSLFEEGARDERVGLAAPQSSGNRSIFGVEGLSQVAVPTLHISAARDLDCTEEAQNRPYWEGLISSDSSAHRWLSFKNGGHASLTVSCQQFPTLELDNGCGEDFTPPEQLQRLSAEYSLSFARAHFGGDAEAQRRFSGALDDELMSLSLP